MTLAINESPNRGDVEVMDSFTTTRYLSFICESWWQYFMRMLRSFRQGAGHYSNNITSLVAINDTGLFIPKDVHLLWNSTDPIPDYITTRFRTHFPDFRVRTYDRTQCEEFIAKFFGEHVSNIFNGFQEDVHRYTLWKYCMLYVYGGCYFDVNASFKTDIGGALTFTKKHFWYTLLDREHARLDASVVVTPPFNPVIRQALVYVVDNPRPAYSEIYNDNYHSTVIQHFETVARIGSNYQTNSWTCVLLSKECDVDTCTVAHGGRVLYTTKPSDEERIVYPFHV